MTLASCASRRDTRRRAFANKGPLEFRDSREDMEDQPPSG